MSDCKALRDAREEKKRERERGNQRREKLTLKTGKVPPCDTPFFLLVSSTRATAPSAAAILFSSPSVDSDQRG